MMMIVSIPVIPSVMSAPTSFTSPVIITPAQALESAAEYHRKLMSSGSSSSSGNMKKDRYVDATWYLNSNRDADEDYKMRRIAGSIRFDIDKIRDTSNDHVSSLPHMLPSYHAVNQWLRDNKVDISKERLVVYTHPGSCAGPRVWWMFTLYGLDAVYLQGGLIAWEAADGDVEWGWNDNDDSAADAAAAADDDAGVGSSASLIDEASANDAVKEYVATLQYINDTNNDDDIIIDARPADRFNGVAAEPRPGLRRGHIPGSINMPFTSVLQPDDSTSFNMDMILNDNNNTKVSSLLREDKKLKIFTCGSGVSAAVVLLADRIANNTRSLKGTKL
ncbi:hypothetical protein FOZ60_006828 [Perkinsus olseni]|nr:hypothetical protein FOZ60_006828 [Perkinsus olseni]